MLGVLSVFCETKNGKNKDIFYSWVVGLPVVALSLERWWCPPGAAGAGCRTCGVLALVLWSCVPSFCPLSRFVLGALLANMALFRVLRAF